MNKTRKCVLLVIFSLFIWTQEIRAQLFPPNLKEVHMMAFLARNVANRKRLPTQTTKGCSAEIDSFLVQSITEMGRLCRTNRNRLQTITPSLRKAAYIYLYCLFGTPVAKALTELDMKRPGIPRDTFWFGCPLLRIDVAQKFATILHINYGPDIVDTTHLHPEPRPHIAHTGQSLPLHISQPRNIAQRRPLSWCEKVESISTFPHRLPENPRLISPECKFPFVPYPTSDGMDAGPVPAPSPDEQIDYDRLDAMPPPSPEAE